MYGSEQSYYLVSLYDSLVESSLSNVNCASMPGALAYVSFLTITATSTAGNLLHTMVGPLLIMVSMHTAVPSPRMWALSLQMNVQGMYHALVFSAYFCELPV